MTTSEMQNRFVRSLAKRCGDIMEAADPAEDLQTLARAFRNLSGLAETYGYHAVTEVSRRCEQLCTAALTDKRQLTPFDRARLFAGVTSIRMYGATS